MGFGGEGEWRGSLGGVMDEGELGRDCLGMGIYGRWKSGRESGKYEDVREESGRSGNVAYVKHLQRWFELVAFGSE